MLVAEYLPCDEDGNIFEEECEDEKDLKVGVICGGCSRWKLVAGNFGYCEKIKKLTGTDEECLITALNWRVD